MYTLIGNCGHGLLFPPHSRMGQWWWGLLLKMPAIDSACSRYVTQSVKLMKLIIKYLVLVCLVSVFIVYHSEH